MTNELGALKALRRTGREQFRNGEATLPFELSDFWAWSVSDLVSNATRGRLAEYIISIILWRQHLNGDVPLRNDNS